MTQSSRAPLTRTLAQWAAAVRYDDLPDAVVHQAKRVLLDYLAATLSGSASGPAKLVQGFLSDTESPGSAGVAGTGLRFSPAGAALANGTAAHGLEVDDGYTPGGSHPGSPTLPAVLAVAEDRGSSAQDIVVAVVVAYEVACRLAGAGHPATWRRGFHNTAIAGVFGAAAGVTTLLGGDARTMGHALGIAGSHAGGLFEFLANGSEVKRLHAGKAARDGLVSAELAVRGLTGPDTVLEGVNGYLHAFADDDYDEEHLVEALGDDWRMLQTYIKPYPCCRHLHGPIDAILALEEAAPIDLDAVESVHVETFTAASRHGGKQVQDLLGAQMSIPYAVAVALIHGRPSLVHFEADVRRDPRVLRLVDLVSVVEEDSCVRDFPRMRPARVTVRVAGEDRVLRVDQPYGEPSNFIADADLEQKLLSLAGPILGPDRCTQVVSEVWQLESPARLFSLLRQPV